MAQSLAELALWVGPDLAESVALFLLTCASCRRAASSADHGMCKGCRTEHKVLWLDEYRRLYDIYVPLIGQLTEQMKHLAKLTLPAPPAENVYSVCLDRCDQCIIVVIGSDVCPFLRKRHRINQAVNFNLVRFFPHEAVVICQHCPETDCGLRFACAMPNSLAEAYKLQRKHNPQDCNICNDQRPPAQQHRHSSYPRVLKQTTS